MATDTTIFSVFNQCVAACRNSVFIRRESSRDKEFHFQHWVRARLEETGLNADIFGRNTYPDFTMVNHAEGYEVKGLAYPGREANYDANSQVPSGLHNGRTIFYVFGRYPAQPDGNIYPVLDLVVCHGSFLNAVHDYVHRNRSIQGFGSYGDILIRDRNMYVAPTPFGLIDGIAHTQTLILPSDYQLPTGYKVVANLVRRETDTLIVGYTFNLKSNALVPETAPNPHAGRKHSFQALRLEDAPDTIVQMRTNLDE